jgi:fructan beta-fructosidase
MSTKGNRDFRPEYHYTPKTGWINDPNGLTYENGTWHLFAQHYPHDTIWGPMHWIHATSTDLLTWEPQGVPLAPDHLGMIFSGSAIIDKGNTSGLGKEKDPMIAMYTSHGDHEQQSIAFSEDRINFTPYTGNPVIANDTRPDFRDPKVFHNSILDCWSMVIAAGDHVEFHASQDLINWKKTGEFGVIENTLGGIFECPDLFSLFAPDGSELWVLIASMALPREFGGSRTQYFLGKFDGKTFTETVVSPKAKLIDSGYDNYAAVSFSGTEKPIIIGWGNSWCYADKEPTNEFCGLMTYARHMTLVNTDEGVRLANTPITPRFVLTPATEVPVEHPKIMSAKSSANLPGEVFSVHVEAEGAFTLALSNAKGEILRVTLDNEHRFVVDRTEAGHRDFHQLYEQGLMSVTVTPRLMKGKVSLDLYFDHMIAEIFADEGTYTNTQLVFPTEPYTKASIIGKAKLWVGAVE